MRYVEQFFKPGDRVMKVIDIITDKGMPTTVVETGKIYVIQEFFPFDVSAPPGEPEGEWNGCSVVGIKNTPGCCWYACMFRRVEEIKLCSDAAAAYQQNQVEEFDPNKAYPQPTTVRTKYGTMIIMDDPHRNLE